MKVTEKNQFNERQVWYLLLHYGFPSLSVGEKPEKNLRIAQIALKKIGVILQGANLIGIGTKDRTKRYIFRFHRYKRDDLRAIQVAETFHFAFSVVASPMIEPNQDDYVFRFPRILLKSNFDLSHKKLIKVEEDRFFEDRCVIEPYCVVSQTTCSTSDRHNAAWRLVPLLISYENLLNAARFLKASQDYFFIYPGEYRRVLENADMPPKTQGEQTRYETSFHNAFKAIEATIGDPPKDDRKFFSRLREMGIDPHEEVGYQVKQQIHIVIRKMNELRDKKSAHGSTRQRKILLGEMFEYQSCAYHVVFSALEKALGEPIFS